MILYGEKVNGAIHMHKIVSVQCDGVSCDFRAEHQAMAQHWVVTQFRYIVVHHHDKKWILHQNV